MFWVQKNEIDRQVHLGRHRPWKTKDIFCFPCKDKQTKMKQKERLKIIFAPNSLESTRKVKLGKRKN